MTSRDRDPWNDGSGSTSKLEDPGRRPVATLRACQLTVLAGPDKGRVFKLGELPVKIGKDPTNDVPLADPSISRQHCVIEDSSRGFLLRDLDSTNGTEVNGTPAREAFLLPGASIVLGGTTLRFEMSQVTAKMAPVERREFHGVLGHSLPMRQLFAYLERVSPTELSLVLTGETGTGKEVVARAIHHASRRAAGPFVSFDCGRADPGLLTTELFGHREGAFTGAVAGRSGAFQTAHGGTLLLDEIGELPFDAQPKLLRALELREIQPLGADRPVPVDVRVLCATHRDLRSMVTQGKFREDLFFRLAGMTLEIPPLRQRSQDILPLAERFLERIRPGLELGVSARRCLRSYSWPGNVRELRNAIERGAALATGTILEEGDLMIAGTTSFPEEPAPEPAASAAPVRSLEVMEKEAVLAALTASAWNKAEAARTLGVTRKTLRAMMARHGIERSGD